MSKDNGGPAFSSSQVTDHNGDIIEYAQSGMTLRDYFASTAPIGVSDANDAFYRSNGRNPRMGEMMEMLAELRGRYADAMLAERAHP